MSFEHNQKRGQLPKTRSHEDKTKLSVNNDNTSMKMQTRERTKQRYYNVTTSPIKHETQEKLVSK